MVYTERAEKHITPTDCNGSGSSNSNSCSAKPAQTFDKKPQNYASNANSWSTKSSSTSSTSSSSSASASSNDKWKYNRMVENQRDKFNNLHFS